MAALGAEVSACRVNRLSDFRWRHPDLFFVSVVAAVAVIGAAGYLAVSLIGGESASAHTVQEATVLVTRTRTLAGGKVVRYRVKRVVRYTPIYRQETVFRHGRQVTIRKVVGHRAVTVSRTVTHGRTVVHSRTATVTGTVTGPGRTVTTPGGTIVVTTTLVRTETIPVTVTSVETVTETTPPVTETVTETVTTP